VLPFVDLSEAKDQEYFTDGLTEELLNSLARVPQLRVTGRTSSFQFKGKNEDVRVIGERLNVASVLEGSVRKAGRQVRITAQLVKVADGFHLWSETYDRQLDDAFAVQDEIARSVAAALTRTLVGAASKRRLPDAEAYNLRLQALYLLRRQVEGDIKKARELAEQAVATDPEYPEAWDTLAAVHVRELEAAQTFAAKQEALGRQQRALERALELDPGLAQAHARLARLRRLKWDFVGADQSMKRALELDPGSSFLLSYAAGFASSMGRFDEAIALQKRVLERDPLSLTDLYNLAFRYLAAGRAPEGEATIRRYIELNPDGYNAHSLLGDALLLQGQADAALVEYEKEADPSARLAGRAMAQHARGDRAASQAALQELVAKFGDQAKLIAEVHAYRGEFDQAFVWLYRAYDRHDSDLVYLKPGYFLHSLHSDPRWASLLRKVGLPAD
jgi:TolB-like protein